MEAPPRGGGSNIEARVDLFASHVSLSTLILAHACSSSRTRHNGADVAEALSVCISPDHSAPGSPGESSPGPGSTTSHCHRRDFLSQAGGSIFHPQPELWKLWAWRLRGPSS